MTTRRSVILYPHSLMSRTITFSDGSDIGRDEKGHFSRAPRASERVIWLESRSGEPLSDMNIEDQARNEGLLDRLEEIKLQRSRLAKRLRFQAPEF